MPGIRWILIGIMLSGVLTPGLAAEAVARLTAKPVHFTDSQFKDAQRSNLRFIVAFLKKNCARCVRQQNVLHDLSLSPEFLALRILIVDFDDAEAIKQFDVTYHDTLILFRGQREISRSNGLLEATSIKRQIIG